MLDSCLCADAAGPRVRTLLVVACVELTHPRTHAHTLDTHCRSAKDADGDNEDGEIKHSHSSGGGGGGAKKGEKETPADRESTVRRRPSNSCVLDLTSLSLLRRAARLDRTSMNA